MAQKNLVAALEIFRALGWDDADAHQVDSLPLGTEEQQAIARRGLSSGRWFTADNTSLIDEIDPYILSLFALRLKVTPKRVVSLLRDFNSQGNHRLNASLLLAHDAEYLTQFIESAASSTGIDESWLFADHDINVTSFFLVAAQHPDIPVPFHQNYLSTWTYLAGNTLKLSRVRISSSQDSIPSYSEVLPTFTAHLQACFDIGLNMWEVVGDLAIRALQRGLIDRSSVVAASFCSLESAQRPGQRREVLAILTEQLKVVDEEIISHLPLVISALSLADPLIISTFATRVLQLVSPDQLADCVLPMLYVTTIKGQKEVLTALNTRADFPSESHDILLSRLTELSNSTDNKVAKLAHGLLEKWDLDQAQTVTNDSAVYQWQETPGVWELPRFTRIDPTPEAIVDLLQQFPVTNAMNTVESEQCFIAFHQLLATDPETAHRLSHSLKSQAPWWMRLTNNPPPEPFNSTNATTMRNAYLPRMRTLVPCVLSEPSFVDCSISFDDILHRLDIYEEAGVPVYSHDFSLALSRLILQELDIPAAQEQARTRHVPVMGVERNDSGINAGECLAEFLAAPYQQPALIPRPSRQWWDNATRYQPEVLSIPTSIQQLPDQLGESIRNSCLDPTVTPRWGDAAWTAMFFHKNAHNNREGAMATQAARSHSTLQPGTAMNLLGLMRPAKKGGLSLAHQAVLDAWARGLLHPGVPDPKYLYWNPENTSYTGFDDIAFELAENGMLSVAWQLLDDILSHTLHVPATNASVTSVVRAMLTLAPSVAHALQSGDAPREAGLVKGLRHYAAKPTATKTRTLARQAIDFLPVYEADEVNVYEQKVDLTAWEKPQPHVVVDTAECSLRFTQSGSSDFTVMVRFPDHATDPLIAGKPCYVSLFELARFPDYHELMLYTDGSFDSRPTIFATWKLKKWVINAKHAQGIPKANRRLTSTAVCALLASLGRKNASVEPFAGFVKEGLVSSESVSLAMKTLLGYELWSPVRALSLLKTDQFVHFLWPLLSECLAAAVSRIDAGMGSPQWLGKVLDLCLSYSPTLRAATKAGYIPANVWQPIVTLAEMKKKTVAVTKAKMLRDQLL